MKMKTATFLICIAMTFAPAVADQVPVNAGATVQYPISTGEGGSVVAPGMTRQDVTATETGGGTVNPDDQFWIYAEISAVTVALGLAVLTRKRRGAPRKAAVTRRAKSA
jgi:hypothetical protein